MSRLRLAVIASLLIHLLFVWSSRWIPVVAHENKTPLEVEFISEKPSQKSQQIVRESLVPDAYKVEKTEDQLAFLSKETQRVKKQVQAAINGMTENRKKQQAKAQQARKESARNNIPTDPYDHSGPSGKQGQSKAIDLPLPDGFSTVGEALPREVEVGNFTALNTDRYLYYSFFARIEELIRFRWETLVRNTLANSRPDLWRGGRPYITHLEIWLKANGEFHSYHLMKGSGLTGLDQAAAQAFAQARLFPNPPQEMVEADGMIRLKYAFQVIADPKVLARP